MIWEITEPLHLHKEASVLYGSFFIVHQPHSGKQSGKSGTKVIATSEHMIFLEAIFILSEGDKFHQVILSCSRRAISVTYFVFSYPSKVFVKDKKNLYGQEVFSDFR